MADIHIHVPRLTEGGLSDDGTVSCDFRGDKYIGKEQGDHHLTIAEFPNASEKLVNLILTIGPEINKELVIDGVEIAGVKLQGRIGVWDD